MLVVGCGELTGFAENGNAIKFPHPNKVTTGRRWLTVSIQNQHSAAFAHWL